MYNKANGGVYMNKENDWNIELAQYIKQGEQSKAEKARKC